MFKQKIKDATFLGIVFGTLTWFGMAMLMQTFLPPELFNFTPWAIIIGIDIFCIAVILFSNIDVKAVNLFTTSISLIQLTYCAHLYNLHIIYLFFLLGTFSATINSLISSEKIHIFIYSLVTMLCSITVAFNPTQYSIIISLGFMIGASFTIATTLVSKKLKEENMRIKIELDQAKKYAHEINSPLLVVKGRVGQVMKKGINLQEEDIKKLKKADENIDKISKIVKMVG
ncbi:MAG: hypothetical protein H6622_07010 [Halobacteriovoraceae bacterium]|nr:hypothetical protein [Halobacteriovoraceae bacterium]